MRINKKGFTLVEILVAVVIIGVLATIAVPMYQTAVDKSRYTTMIVPARNLASAQERYLMENGRYSSDLAMLDVHFGKDVNGRVDSISSGLTASIGDDSEYEYVKVSKEGMNNNYIIYLDKSENFSNEIHCEALKDNTRAERLCKELGGERIHGSLTDGYNTYVLSGKGKGVSYSILSSMNGIVCEESENSGKKSCEVTKVNNSVIKTVCSNSADPKTCKYYIHDEDANTWECDAAKSKLAGDTCIATGTGTYLKRWDEDGNRIEGQCDSYDTSKNACSQLAERTYNKSDTKIEADRRYCAEYDSDGRCLSYKQNQGYDSFGTHNSSNDKALGDRGQAGSMDYASSTTYWTQLNCATVNDEGVCTSYKDGWFATDEWNENKKNIFHEVMNCSSITADKQCAEVSSYTTAQGQYTPKGQLEYMSVRECLAKDSSGNCTQYSRNSNSNYQEAYTYDSNNKTTSYSKYNCASTENATECTQYSSSKNTSYVWNGSASKALSEITVGCGKYDANNNCTQYSSETSTYRTYASNNTTQTSFTTVKCNKYTGLVCTGGYKVVYTPIVNGKDDLANRVTIDNCSNVDMTNGQCLD